MTEPAPGSATVRRMLVGAHLRRLREERGITRAQAGYTIRASESKMSRLELGRVAFKERDVSDLLVFYGVNDPEQRDAVLALVEEANRPGWWRQYEDVMPGWFQNYVGLEEAATALRTYETHFVPGLLQTPDYARAVLASTVPPLAGFDLERAVTLRMTRQQVLSRPDPLRVWAVVDEGALRREVGDPQVHRAQLHHLLELAELAGGRAAGPSAAHGCARRRRRVQHPAVRRPRPARRRLRRAAGQRAVHRQGRACGALRRGHDPAQRRR